MSDYRLRASTVGVALIFALLVLSACMPGAIRASGQIVGQEREVSDFDRIELATVGDMTIEQADVESLTVIADDNILPMIDTRVRQGVLEITLDRPLIMLLGGTIHYDLKVKDLRGLGISGSGEAAMDRLRTEDLRLDISGSGRVTIADITASMISTEISGSGKVQLAGTTETQAVNVSGSGDYMAGDLASSTARVDVSGSGAVTVWATDALDANISGSGNVVYYGRPLVNQSVSGSGKISASGDK